LSFTVELRQQPSSQGQRVARGRPGAAPQLVPLLSFTVEFTFATVFRPDQNSQDKIELRLHYGSSEKSGSGAAPRLFPLLSFTVKLQQQPSSQGQRAARGQPGAEPQLVPLLSFTVALLKNYDLLRLLPYFDRIKTALKVDEIKYSFCFRIPAVIDF
jgi:hypothetical protein